MSDTRTLAMKTATRLSCDCATCKGRAVTASTSRVEEAATTPKSRRELAHTLVSYGYGNSPLAAVMRGRYDVRTA